MEFCIFHNCLKKEKEGLEIRLKAALDIQTSTTCGNCISKDKELTKLTKKCGEQAKQKESTAAANENMKALLRNCHLGTFAPCVNCFGKPAALM